MKDISRSVIGTITARRRLTRRTCCAARIREYESKRSQPRRSGYFHVALRPCIRGQQRANRRLAVIVPITLLADCPSFFTRLRPWKWVGWSSLSSDFRR